MRKTGKIGKKIWGGGLAKVARAVQEEASRQGHGGRGMDALRDFLEECKRHEAVRQHFLGLLHILIGRRIATADGTILSNGMTWRECAALLKRQRWDRNMTARLAFQLEELPPRDRERYWYLIIARAGVDSARAREDADRLAEILRSKNYIIGAGPAAPPQP